MPYSAPQVVPAFPFGSNLAQVATRNISQLVNIFMISQPIFCFVLFCRVHEHLLGLMFHDFGFCAIGKGPSLSQLLEQNRQVTRSYHQLSLENERLRMAAQR